MAENNDQERTEEATLKRLEQAREKGQVPRSRELVSIVVLLMGAVALMWFGGGMGGELLKIMQKFFTLTREEILDVTSLGLIIYSAIFHLAWQLSLILLILFFAGLVGASALGGVSFSWKAVRPTFSKISPIQGIKRMFGKQSMVELIKSILKVFLVSGAAFYLMWTSVYDFYQLNIETFPANIYHALDILLNFVMIICSSLLVVVAIDVPFQIWQYKKQLKMTKQEIKDEYKDSEGKPEVKGRIRMLQREMAQGRMMTKVSSADVVITNPDHYSVALCYDSKIYRAPIVVAKGSDFMAIKIREIAAAHDITIVSAASLARAVYFSTELEQQIPDGLFVAIAQLLAYVFQLKQYKKGSGRKPKSLEEKQFQIPTELRR
ncbi:flagellar biosynthesis protein FlhB [Candidatus Enterovibrio escicola]|uniref:Flagellar biosynthetic protein FlhB n=1 Tax=Candidatus Enterovibrio escicola TaxID=1927127 RepID=A0A2A5T1F5_9GAMM|nr:flagellar biosynthesis protein FlhB [Candidatus Enterovibrio escacola]PCS21999.1 Flagellar biosynthesis protein FlhB [Candidatus Enterovibrio escacola]